MLFHQRLRAAKYTNIAAFLLLYFALFALFGLLRPTDAVKLVNTLLPWHLPDATTTTTIPKTIWYKLGSQPLSEEATAWAHDCFAKNPTWRASYLTDTTADAWVARAYPTRPDIIHTFTNLTIPILKADFLRYLLLHHGGGLWLDLDVECGALPIDAWIPAQFRGTTNLVVGWEFDAGLPSAGGPSHQLNSWTIMAAPGSPHMLRAIEDVVAAVHDEASEHCVEVEGLRLGMLPDVVDFTGPARMTRSVFRSLESTLGRSVDRRVVQGILKPTQIGDVLFMPGWAFAASQGGYSEEEQEKIGDPLVMHH